MDDCKKQTVVVKCLRLGYCVWGVVGIELYN
jgi:hypothetical protein